MSAGPAAFDAVDETPLLDDALQPLTAEPGLLAAVRDKNRDRTIDWSGAGDEDGDSLTDYEEACELGTDPCDADTDNDGQRDDVDPEPLNPDA